MAKRLFQNILMAMASIVFLSCTSSFVVANAEGSKPFRGDGTSCDPYLIQDERDLFRLSELVAEGETFENAYFYQTNDIRFISGRYFTPIGNIDAGTYFAGNYEGGGHVLSRMRMQPVEGYLNYALFGALAGTISNLGVIDSYFEGALVATFAATGVPGTNSGIYHCFSTAQLVGYDRVGMIVDNYNGVVSDCWAMSEEQYPLVGYDAKEIVHSFGNGPASGGEPHSITEYTKVVDRTFADELNETSLTLSMEKGILPVSFNQKCTFKPYIRTYKGKGTKKNPYLLSNKEDVMKLSALVNSGEDYAGCYFALNADIDFKGERLVPIGNDNTKRTFAGVLDGRGYTISNVLIDRAQAGQPGVCALFGKLDGTIVNLVLDHVKVKSFIASGIAVSGGPNSLIYNCSVTNLDVQGEFRQSAIVDNFAGYMSAIYYDGTLPLVGVEGRTVSFCVTAGEIVGNADYVNVDHNIDHFSGNVAVKMNEIYPFAVMRICADPTLARSWVNGKPCGEARASLNGRGTKNSPYLIENELDLVFFCSLVNSGKQFEGAFVKQTKDLNMDGLYFLPIGVDEMSYRFYGTYDGAGHTISNLVIPENELTYQSALFGKFSGTLVNLGLESGEVHGTLSAGLVSAGYVASIRNCYSKLSVYGSVRSGGLVDDFNGKIMFCSYDNEQALPVASWAYHKIFYTLGTGKIAGRDGAGPESEHCYECVDFSALTSEFWKEYNTDILVKAAPCGYDRNTFVLRTENGFGDRYFSLTQDTIEEYGLSLMIECYKWNVAAVLGMIVAAVGIPVSFLIERKVRRKKHEN